jgi:hypothetical protein
MTEAPRQHGRAVMVSLNGSSLGVVGVEPDREVDLADDQAALEL